MRFSLGEVGGVGAACAGDFGANRRKDQTIEAKRTGVNFSVRARGSTPEPRGGKPRARRYSEVVGIRVDDSSTNWPGSSVAEHPTCDRVAPGSIPGLVFSFYTTFGSTLSYIYILLHQNTVV